MLYKPYFQKESPSPDELTHHGVLGMKWGVRRFQNKDGTLTSAGKRRAQKEANILSKAMEKHLDTTNDFQRSLKKVYLVDKDGNNSRGIIKYDRNKLAAKERNEQSYLKIKDIMNKSYDSVKVDATYDLETGKSSSKIFLKKNGENFVSEFTKDYGAFDTSYLQRKASKISYKMEDVRNQKLQKRAAELASKYGDKAKVEVKGNKIVVTGADGKDTWTVT